MCPRSRARSARTAPIAFRINPDVAAGTHAKITTGTADNKFGIAVKRGARRFRRSGAPARARGHGA